MNTLEILSIFLAHLRGERRLSGKTVEAYQRDIAGFLGFLTKRAQLIFAAILPIKDRDQTGFHPRHLPAIYQPFAHFTAI
jgi:site-specific recombinase XerC